MNPEAEKEKLQVLSVKINQATRDRWEELKTDGAYDTAGQFMDSLLERYANPLKINRENEEAVKNLKAQVRDMQLTIDKLTGELNLTQESYNKVKDAATHNADAVSKLQEQLENANAELEQASKTKRAYETNMNGKLAVPVEPLDLMCLQYLAERENKQRKRTDITPEAFFMYCVREMLIKGNKFSIDCVPDSVIMKFKNQLKASKEE